MVSLLGAGVTYAVDVAPGVEVRAGQRGEWGHVIFDWEADVVISPLLAMSSVYEQMDHPLSPRWWAPLTGARAQGFMRALASAVRARPVVGVEEARRELRRCQTFARSARNREAAIIASGGRCAGCDLGWGAHFGDGVLDAHHLRPLGAVPTSVRSVHTRVTDLAVLCPTCHRLIHRLPLVSPGVDALDALRAELQVFFAAG